VRLGLLFLVASLLLASDLSPERRLFEASDWEVWCASDSGAAPRFIEVSVRGGSPRRCSELRVRRRVPGADTPQVFSIKGIGALRPALPPPGAFGATFYASGYWDCDLGLRQTLAIEALDVALDAERPGALRFAGRAAYSPTLEARDFRLRLEPPTPDALRAEVAYTLEASGDVCLRSAKQLRHEGFRIARAASNYISGALHDSDGVRYAGRSGRAVCVPLANREDFVLGEPEGLDGSPLVLVHASDRPRPTPTVAIRFLEPPPAEVTPQGYVSATLDPDADNIDVWGNWDAARERYRAGERIGRFTFVLETLAPGGAPCGPAG
jgi:hypothetical protein